MYNISSNLIPAQCAATSVGAANQFLITMVQTLVAAHCAMSPASIWPKDYGKRIRDKDDFDFIIVGGGTAGAVIAARLTENPQWNVLVIELGGNPPFESQATNMFLFMTKSRVVIPYYEKTEYCCRLDPKGCYWPRGKMLGGSSGVGFSLFLHGNEQNYNDWAASGCPGWDFESVLPYFRKSEGNTDPELVRKYPRIHNADGPSKVEFGTPDPLNNALYQALIDSGEIMTDDLNLPFSRGYGRIQTGTYNGRRYSTARTFLMPNKDRPNLHVMKHAFVKKIILKGNQAIGVEYVYKNKVKRAYARKEIILSAGTFGSVGVLLRSGIGPSNELVHHKIKPRVNLPVGRNMIEHSYVHLLFSLKYSAEKGDPVKGPSDHIYQFLMHNSGPFSTLPYTVGHFNTNNISDYANYQRYFTSFPWGSPPYYKNFLEFFSIGPANQTAEAINERGDLLIITICSTLPKSRGRVTLDEHCPKCKKVKLHSNLLSEPEDRITFVKAMKSTFELFDKEPFRKLGMEYVPHPITECDTMKYLSDEYLDCVVRYQSSCGSHPTGTSRMGAANDPSAVLDERGRFYNITNLRQFDAGIIPVPLAVNTWSNVLMLGEKGADMIKEDHMGK